MNKEKMTSVLALPEFQKYNYIVFTDRYQSDPGWIIKDAIIWALKDKYSNKLVNLIFNKDQTLEVKFRKGQSTFFLYPKVVINSDIAYLKQFSWWFQRTKVWDFLFPNSWGAGSKKRINDPWVIDCEYNRKNYKR